MKVASATREAIYPLSYAARLVELDVNTARRWIRGYHYLHKGEQRSSAPVIPPTVIDPDDAGRLTFEELLTLRLVRAFRDDARLSLRTIKAAARIAATTYGVGNPFVTKLFRTDGEKIFIALRRSAAVAGDERVLVEALTGQQQFSEVVEPSLFQNVVFTNDELQEWRPEGLSRSVVIRPDRAFGAPHIDGTGVRTDVLADAVAAEGGGEAALSDVATWFGLDTQQVRDAVDAEAAWRLPRTN